MRARFERAILILIALLAIGVAIYVLLNVPMF